MFCFFFFQAEDGIRDLTVTGVQTCALPIWFSGTITVALGSNPGGATLSGTLLVAAVGGVASFGDLSLNRTAPGYTRTAKHTAELPAQTNPVCRPLLEKKQPAFNPQPTNTGAGGAVKPAVQP